MSGWIDRNGWIHCPTCGNKTRTKVNPDTVLKHFPLFCPKCGKEHIVDVQGKHYIIRARRQDAEPIIYRINPVDCRLLLLTYG